MKKLKTNIEDKLKELETDVHNAVMKNEKYERTLYNNQGIDIMIPGVAYTHQSKSTAMDILKRYSFVRKGSSAKLARVGKDEFIKKCIECAEGTSDDKLKKFLNRSKSKTDTKKSILIDLKRYYDEIKDEHIDTKEQLLADVECYFDDLKKDMICQVDTMIKIMLEVLDKHIDV